MVFKGGGGLVNHKHCGISTLIVGEELGGRGYWQPEGESLAEKVI